MYDKIFGEGMIFVEDISPLVFDFEKFLCPRQIGYVYAKKDETRLIENYN